MKIRQQWVFDFFQNLDDAAYKLRASKYWLHKAIMGGVVLDNVGALLVYMDIISGNMIPNYGEEHNHQRRIPEDSTGKKRRRCEGDDSNCKLRKTGL